jgi:hypothetical protein
MISKNRSAKKNIRRALTRLGNGTALTSQRTRSRKNLPHKPGPESVRSMIKRGKLGIFRLISRPGNPRQVDLP